MSATARRRILRERPDILLTTPESLESMLVSVNVDHRAFFAGLRAVVVDEVHAFAGDDRGWHLLAVLERLTRVTGRPLQRVGLSATVGNPAELLRWLQGSGATTRPGQVVAPGLPHDTLPLHHLGPHPGHTPTDAPQAVRPPGPQTHNDHTTRHPEPADTQAAHPPGPPGGDVRVTGRPGTGDAPGGLEGPGGAGRASGGDASAPPPGDVQLDYVGTVANSATVIASLHHREKRLVFCDSKQLVEELGHALRARGVTTFLSHASLSADERRRSEQAFAEARDCVIVATSTLELGIDVGDLDRVIQLNAPMTVASFLQRLGRTGRRPGTVRNRLFLALTQDALLQAAGLLLLWGQGWVEPIVPPPEPRHIAAQQLLALCLQEHRVGDRLWAEWWNGLGPFGPSAAPIVAHLVEAGYLDRDGGMLFIGPEAERRFGHRHFMNLTAVFTAAPEFTVLAGRTEIGRTDSALLTEEIQGPRLLLLGGRTWRVTYIDWRRRRCFVEPADGRGKARWNGAGLGGLSFAMTRAMRSVLLGADPPVRLTRRAVERLAGLRDEAVEWVHPGGTVITRAATGDVRWWTWAGFRANVTLAATLAGVADEGQRVTDTYLRLREELTVEMWRAATGDAAERLCLPDIDEKALSGLKFSAALPERLATATLAARLADLPAASAVLAEPSRFTLTG